MGKISKDVNPNKEISSVSEFYNRYIQTGKTSEDEALRAIEAITRVSKTPELVMFLKEDKT